MFLCFVVVLWSLDSIDSVLTKCSLFHTGSNYNCWSMNFLDLQMFTRPRSIGRLNLRKYIQFCQILKQCAKPYNFYLKSWGLCFDTFLWKMGPKSKISSEIKHPLLPDFIVIFSWNLNFKCSCLVEFFSKNIFSIRKTAYIVFLLYAAWEIRDSKLITHGLLSFRYRSK